MIFILKGGGGGGWGGGSHSYPGPLVHVKNNMLWLILTHSLERYTRGRGREGVGWGGKTDATKILYYFGTTLHNACK